MTRDCYGKGVLTKRAHHKSNLFGPVAQLVERRPEEPGVGGSIPSWSAMNNVAE